LGNSNCQIKINHLGSPYTVSASQVAACACQRCPLMVVASWPSNHVQKGKVTAGKGRSLISSAGNASCEKLDF
jgi:hypothetical protein